MKRTTKTNDGITAIYVRRSVSDKDKGNNSLSISAQREECIKFVGDCEYQVYCDDGKSGKDVQHRPEFMQMMQDARDGLISRIIVKKYDRFSRNMREYFNPNLSLTVHLTSDCYSGSLNLLLSNPSTSFSL